MSEEHQAMSIKAITALRDGEAIFDIVKVYGQVEFQRKGGRVMGGVTWVPDGRFPIAIRVEGEEVLTIDQAVVLFKDLLRSLMPAVDLLDEPSLDDF